MTVAPGTQCEIRRLRAADQAELRRLVHALFPDADAAQDVDRYLHAGSWPVVFVAQRAAGSLAGFIELGTRPYAEGCETSPVGYIEAWYVDKDVRRQGIGRRLFEAAEAYARSQRLTEMASDALIDNAISIAAHQALGYQEVERQVCFMRRLQ